MLIADAQIHLWNKGTPSAHHRQQPYSAEAAIAGMDAAGTNTRSAASIRICIAAWFAPHPTVA